MTWINILSLLLFIGAVVIPVYITTSNEHEGAKKWALVILVIGIFLLVGLLFSHPPFMRGF